MVAAVLWAVAVIPAAMGFWLVAGSVAGVGPGQVDTLVTASLLALGIATVLQVAFGFRLPMYEGPASAYLAAITVVGAEGYHGLASITGGLLAAGGFVALLGILGADRLIARAFTPLVANVFVMTVTLAVTPATIERAIGATHGLPGRGAAWGATVVVVVVTLIVRRSALLVPYSLFAALVAGTVTYLALEGVPHVQLGGGVGAPGLFPWGAPRENLGVIAPFLLAGALAAFNTVASGKVVAGAHDLEIRPGAQRSSFLMHGAAQAGGAVFGNLVGTVSRLDSVGIARLLDHRGRVPLLAAGVLVGALAFVRPVVNIAAAVPLSVSAALLGMLLSLVMAHALSGISREPRALQAIVVLPALIPTAAWIAVGSSLAPGVQLVANPMLWGVLLAMWLERIVRPRYGVVTST
jgi:xanthine/uracil permease